MADRSADRHNTAQTAFRLPEGLLAWLREQAEHEGGGRTMTEIVVRALEAERERCAGITTRAIPAEVVSPPQPPLAPAAAAAAAAEDEQAHRPGKNCRHPNFRGVKGVCPDCHQPVGYK